MASFVPIEDDEGNQIYIEVIPTGSQSGIKQTSKDSGVADKLTADDLKRMIRQAVMPTCQTFVDVWQELNQPLTADSAEVEFNVGFTASGNAVIMQASGQASFKVKVNWKFQPPAVPNISQMRTNEDFNANLDSLESDIERVKTAKRSFLESRTDNRDFTDSGQIEGLKRKLNNITLNVTEKLYLQSKNCDRSPNCDKTITPEQGGCCRIKDQEPVKLFQRIEKIHEYLQQF
ncbi:CU044_2847 family protein [Microcoleus sp. S13C4]|uniref:CU044_2847 family protein n=1 Tax=Microcoleus sp. S13C4 TaxID=3055410 RepID=UPI002FD67745